MKILCFSPRQQTAGAKPTTSGYIRERQFHWFTNLKLTNEKSDNKSVTICRRRREGVEDEGCEENPSASLLCGRPKKNHNVVHVRKDDVVVTTCTTMYSHDF